MRQSSTPKNANNADEIPETEKAPFQKPHQIFTLATYGLSQKLGKLA
jgi:hypothetical protein